MFDSDEDDEDRPVALSRVGRLIPSRPSLQTVLRWCTSGIRRRADGATIKLDSILIGSRRFCRPSAVARFIEDCNGGSVPCPRSKGSKSSKALQSLGC